MNKILIIILLILIFLKINQLFMITYKENYNFISENRIENLKKYKNIINELSNLESDSFENTNSLVYYFNLDFLKSNLDQEVFKTLNDIVEKSPKKGNYFIANFLEVKPCNNTYAPNLHTDCTICGIMDCPEDLITPEIVGVLYLEVPKCIEGGELVVLGNINQIRKYKPEANKLIYFNGNFIHGVKSYNLDKCPDKTTRFSLVIEIYNLDKDIIKTLPIIKIN